MSKQTDLIGEHPRNNHPIGEWLAANDIVTTATKCHRELTEITPEKKQSLIDWMAKTLIKHHYTDFRPKRLKEKFKELGFEKYAEQHRKLPVADKVKKGNATEVLLTEYIQGTLGKELIKVFKLKYNPNVDQAIKGDDTLMVDLSTVEGKDALKVFLGESKFRKNPNKQVVDDISASLNKDKMPLSYSFLVEEIAKQDVDLALKLDEFIIQDVKDKGNLIYTGLLLSNSDSSRFVENNLNNDNPSLIFISMGIDNPEDFIYRVFDKANELIANPDEI